jgi:hypothetical protein
VKEAFGPNGRAYRPLLGLAFVASAATILWLNRGTTYWIDSLSWVLLSPDLDLETALRPHEGHFVLVPRLVYKVLLELFGTAYLPLRLVGLAALWACVLAVFAFARKRVPAHVALAPCAVLLFFGSDMLHVLADNAFTVDLALACGVGALLALERQDRRGYVAACVLLCLGILTYTVALAFLAAAAVALLLGADRWRRIWVVAVPAAIYLAWLVWTRQQGVDSGDTGASAENVLLIPSWSFQSLSAVLAALSGLDFDFEGQGPTALAGTVLALAALAALLWRFSRRAAPATLWVAAAVPFALWSLQALTANGFRFPDSPRYLLPGAVAALLLASEAARGVRWSRPALIGLYALAVAGLATNLYLLDRAAGDLRDRYAPQVRVAFGALDVAGRSALPRFETPTVGEESIIPGGQSPLTFAFDRVLEADRSPVAAYRRVAARYGSLGYSVARIEAQDEGLRAQADAVLVAALGIAPAAGAPAEVGQCVLARAGAGGIVAAPLPPGGAVLQAAQPAGELAVRRFADAVAVPLGPVAADTPVVLRVRRDELADRPWVATIPAASLRFCSLR